MCLVKEANNIVSFFPILFHPNYILYFTSGMDFNTFRTDINKQCTTEFHFLKLTRFISSFGQYGNLI